MSTFGPSPWFKKAKIFGYARISSAEQSVQDKKVKTAKKKTTIKRQMDLIQKRLKEQGLPKIKDSDFYAEVRSGTDSKRPEWAKVRAAAMAHEGPAVIVVKDPSRWARNTEDAVEAWAPLKRKGVPIYAVDTGVQTGTMEDIRPNEAFFFLLNSGFAASVSEVQKAKAVEAVERQKEEGVLPAKGQSIFPLLEVSPFQTLRDNLSLLSARNGRADLKRALEATSGGRISIPAAERLISRELAIMEALGTDYEDYFQYRERIRTMTGNLGHDPWAKFSKDAGPISWPARALMRQAGLFIQRPPNGRMLSIPEIEAIVQNPFDFLSDKDKKRFRKQAV
jgi:DNA invertase Pin-like site-specific DNA recombinase